MISVHHYLILSAILFCIGTFGVLTRKNAIVIFMCIEVMLNSVNLTFIALSKHVGICLVGGIEWIKFISYELAFTNPNQQRVVFSWRHLYRP